MIQMYAIPNCDTVKKARLFLEKKKINYDFIDFKKTPPTKDLIKNWMNFLGELPVNKKGTTYRKFKDEFEVLSIAKKIDFMIENSSMIIRPVLVKNGITLVMGFSAEEYEGLKF